MRFTTAELAELESRIASRRRPRRWPSSWRMFDALAAPVRWRRPTRSRRRPRRWPRSTSPPRWPSSPTRDGWTRPVVDDSARLRDRGRAPPGGRGGAAARRRSPSSPTTADLSARPSAAPAHRARHRPQHGRQVDLPAPERADRGAGAGGLLRAGARAPRSASSTGCSARRRRRRSRARPLDLHGRDGRDRRDPQPGDASARWSSSTRSAAAPRPSTACRSPGRRSSICTRSTAAARCSPRIIHELTALAAPAAAARQRHRAGQGMAGRRGVPARGGARRGRPLLRHPGGASSPACRAPWWSAPATILDELEARRPAGAGASAWSTTCRCSPPRPPAAAPPRPPAHRTRCATALAAHRPRRADAARGAGGAVPAEEAGAQREG